MKHVYLHTSSYCLDFVIVLYKWDLAYASMRWRFNSWEKKTL